MKTSFSFLFGLLGFAIVTGQNLVPNFDFEQYNTCPTGLSQTQSLSFWTTPTTNAIGVSGTPDYFNSCAPIQSNVNTPYGVFGYQTPLSGEGYAGLYIKSNSIAEYREYIEVQLNSPLITDSCYHFSMYISPANTMKYTSDAIGVYFSDSMVSGINNYVSLPFLPQIANPIGNFITDTINWTSISANYLAHGGERFLIIGNFSSDTSTSIFVINNSPSSINNVYFYLEDIKLEPIVGCDNVSNPKPQTKEIHFAPNPFEEFFTVFLLGMDATEISMRAYNAHGQKVLDGAVSMDNQMRVVVDTRHWAAGMYVVEVEAGAGIEYFKVVKSD